MIWNLSNHPWWRTKGNARRNSWSTEYQARSQPGLSGPYPISLKRAFQNRRTARLGHNWHPQDSPRFGYTYLKTNPGENVVIDLPTARHQPDEAYTAPDHSYGQGHKAPLRVFLLLAYSIFHDLLLEYYFEAQAEWDLRRFHFMGKSPSRNRQCLHARHF